METKTMKRNAPLVRAEKKEAGFKAKRSSLELASSASSLAQEKKNVKKGSR